ncbi:hypothetical protein SAMN05661096_00736 [Marivirga sericea]|uniref:Uncharacterized protein n=1 Tax=Marivirga sericea TaxID=1028 RepID=A0A1X7IK13_9BACT|nr:hypothetical protein [Marivirga sericea]SMG15195.1 hypothetical protein SAMN05661096_00736 [Marivirga sericea]
MKKIFLFMFALSFISNIAFSQKVEINTVKINGGELEIHYNLVDERIDRSYAISLYTSKDNFIQPMKSVKGDIGIDIVPGNNKVVKWNAKEELGSDFKGDIAVELKGNYYVPFITLEGIQEGREFKRGNKYDIVWSGGRGDNILNFELYRGENLVSSFEKRPNTGKTSLDFPSMVKPGDNYYLKVSDTKNRDDVILTENFSIKRKFPLSLQVAAGAVVGAGLVILIQSLIPEPEFQIGDPPDPSR